MIDIARCPSCFGDFKVQAGVAQICPHCQHRFNLPDPYYYAREHDGSGWSVRGPGDFVIKKPDGPLDKSEAYVIAKILSGKHDEALAMLRDLTQLLSRT